MTKLCHLVPGDDPNARIKPVAGTPLTFRTEGIGKPSDVAPRHFFKVFNERYSIDWTVLLPGQEETPAAPARRR